MPSTNIYTAVLMPTYGRPNAVKDTLEACLDLYEKYNFDIYIFDSNGNNDTQNIVLELQKKHDNLYYIRLCEFIHLDCKWLDMVRGKYLKKDYDYFYPCGDANSLTEYSLKRIYPYLEQKVDMVNIRDNATILETSVFFNANDFFNYENMNISLWGGGIYSCKTIFNLNDEEWNNTIAKWFKKDFEYISYEGFILDQISKCCPLHIVSPAMGNVDRTQIMYRSKEKSGSFWLKNTIKLRGITYPKVYDMLPEIYTNKDEKLNVLLKTTFNYNFMKMLKKNYGFSLIDFLYYKNILKKRNLNIMNFKILLLSLSLPSNLMNKIKKIFSIKKENNTKIIYFFGIKFSYKKKSQRELYNNIFNSFESNNKKATLKALKKYYRKYKHDKIYQCLKLSDFACRNGYKNEKLQQSAFIYRQLCQNIEKQVFETYLKSKTNISIVGNSGRELGKNQGQKIDSSDIIVRFNNYPENYEKDYGSKCNVWLRGWGNKGEISDKNLENLDFVIFGPNLFAQTVPEHIIEWLYNNIKKYPEKISFIKPEDYEEIFTKYKVSYPTNGFISIYYLSKFIDKSNIKIYGFSFLDEDGKEDNTHYYDNKCNIVGHTIDEERKVLRKLFL